ncbi:hypothetical protein [Cohnella herbarum]|uniref:Uncharacterized protein n=1 Tax=Cohnella herbarum TaxID=2728023 RepID=A0A7Z2VLV4_9BACL|nr:hypothetical protein [Cohnella herbarum]QJD85706.1 hypothetical protein HH215_22640 [Cohnella herbarum]
MDKQRDYARVVTLIYALGILITLAVVFLAVAPYSRTSHTWLSSLALLLAETAIYGLVLHYLSQGKRSSGLIPGYLAFSAIAGLYLIVVIVFIIVFSLVLDVSTTSYVLLHFIALAIAAIMASLVTLYVRHSEQQDGDPSSSSIQWVPEVRDSLLSIKQELEGWNDEASSRLSKDVANLDEKVRYSDPTSHPSLADTEADVLNQVQLLAREINGLKKAAEANGQSERIGRQIQEIGNLIARRNQKLIQLKG